YVDADGVVEAGAAGLVADWANRAPLLPVAMKASPHAVEVVTKAPSLHITSTFRFDPDGPRLIVQLLLRNSGPTTLHDVFATREWQDPTGSGISFPMDRCSWLTEPPAGVTRRVWDFGDLRPGAETGATYTMTWLPTSKPPGPSLVFDVPLALWTNTTFPTGLDFGSSNGVSFGDYDRDGWIDVFCLQSARLWRNLQGTGWQLVADLDQSPTQILMPTVYRYGSSFGDYDNDGFPDLAVEPRACCNGADRCFHLLQNLGIGATFAEVATPAGTIITEPCGLDAETAGWADVDNDGDLDLFLPVYPPWVTSVGNFFWTNLGPTGPSGAYRFQETSAASGLDNPTTSYRPEGAQFCDVDHDGDLDLYSNGTLYQNRTTQGIDFDALTAAAAGIGLQNQLDEGAMFFDYDMDGDEDLFVVYTSQGVKLWESYGDGMFFQGEPTIITSASIGLDLGMSAEDWDNDGDIDFTTRQVFRRNMLVETGTRQFTVATHGIPSYHLTSATPAWGDWDHDGDLDCALGNWLNTAHFYENTLYDTTTPAADRRYVRVQPLRDSATVAAGLQTEFGAAVTIMIAGETDVVRRKFTASGHGYLNQNEYALHFALPQDPDPGDPAVDLRFDVVVNFPTRSAEGIHRVDKHVNPALGSIDFATLTDREILVFRSGVVRINGFEMRPSIHEAPPLFTSGGGLRLPTATTPNPAPSQAPNPDQFVGLDFDTNNAPDHVRIAEIVLDGQLAAPVTGPNGPFNVALWDVTQLSSPVLVQNGTLNRTTSSRNRRSFLAVDWLLPPGHRFRLVAKVTALRATSIPDRRADGPVNTLGGLLFRDASPATGSNVGLAVTQRNTLYLAIRCREALVDKWVDLGFALPGSNAQTPWLVGNGRLVAGTTQTLELNGALPFAPVALLYGTSIDCQPFLGGTLIPDNPPPPAFLTADANGHFRLSFQLAFPLPSGLNLAVQAWLLDTGNPLLVSASNAIWVTAH
ncbi:MAG: VCBS repeat-containing protein, partial [Planctomycetes bacterium]|nr:VCBS repeat-containing protein [Planctomycetota bacterium]